MTKKKSVTSVAEFQKQIAKWKKYSECESPECLRDKFLVIRLNMEKIREMLKEALRQEKVR